MNKADKVVENRRRINELRQIASKIEDRDERYKYILERQALEDEATELLFQMGDEGEQLNSVPVWLDTGVADFFIQILLRVKIQIDKELTRTDLYPNIHDELFRKRRSIEEVIDMLKGRRGVNEIMPVPMYSLLAEYADDSVEFMEADDDEEADELEDALVEDGAVVTRYFSAPLSGNQLALHYPTTALDNQFKPVKAHVLWRIILGVGKENVKLPEDYTLPQKPSWVTEIEEGDV